jgi:uncharacterized small protein (DUF1192 family)
MATTNTMVKPSSSLLQVSDSEFLGIVELDLNETATQAQAAQLQNELRVLWVGALEVLLADHQAEIGRILEAQENASQRGHTNQVYSLSRELKVQRMLMLKINKRLALARQGMLPEKGGNNGGSITLDGRPISIHQISDHVAGLKHKIQRTREHAEQINRQNAKLRNWGKGWRQAALSLAGVCERALQHEDLTVAASAALAAMRNLTEFPGEMEEETNARS